MINLRETGDNSTNDFIGRQIASQEQTGQMRGDSLDLARELAGALRVRKIVHLVELSVDSVARGEFGLIRVFVGQIKVWDNGKQERILVEDSQAYALSAFQVVLTPKDIAVIRFRRKDREVSLFTTRLSDLPETPVFWWQEDTGPGKNPREIRHDIAILNRAKLLNIALS